MNPYIALSTAVLSDHRLIEPELFATYVRGLLYSKVHQTDGFIPADALPLVTLGVTRDVTFLVTRLVTSGLWFECANGYTVGAEKWAKWQETKDDDERRRACARDRQRAKRERDAAKLAQYVALKVEHTEDSVTRDSRVSHSEVTVQRREEKRREESKEITTPTPSKGRGGAERKKRDPSRKWGQVYEELKVLLPESHHACLKDWCVYAKEKKYPAWVELTVRKNAAEWREWTAERLGAMVDHTIKKSWQGLQEPEKPKQFAQPNGKPASPRPITVEQAQAMITGEGLEDRGSPVTGRRFSGGQN